MDSEIREWRQILLVDRVPKPQLRGDPAVEVAEDVETVSALRCCRQPEQLDRVHVLEERLVGRRRRVVELVDDHDVEVSRVDAADVGAVKALDRREDVLEAQGALPADPLLAKGGVAQCVPERGTALVEDLLAVGDEEQAAAGELGSKPRVVDRGDHGLAGTRGRHEQVAMVALVAGEHDLFEERFLERAELELDRAE